LASFKRAEANESGQTRGAATSAAGAAFEEKTVIVGVMVGPGSSAAAAAGEYKCVSLFLAENKAGETGRP
jgi:hypothetical protein